MSRVQDTVPLPSFPVTMGITLLPILNIPEHLPLQRLDNVLPVAAVLPKAWKPIRSHIMIGTSTRILREGARWFRKGQKGGRWLTEPRDEFGHSLD